MESSSGGSRALHTVPRTRDHDRASGPGIDPARKSDPSRKGVRRHLIATLRFLGILRKIDRPVVGPKAYPRWWERLRALVVLAGIVVGIGVGLAAVVGIAVLGLGFLLEQAIS